MLTPLAKLIVSAIVQFIIASASALTMHMAVKEAVVMPTRAVWILIVALGVLSAAKDVHTFLQQPPAK